MKEFKILWEWPKCGIKTASEQLLSGKRHWLKVVTNLWFVVKKKKCNKVKRSKGQCGGMRSAGNAASQLSPVRSWGHAFREGGLRGACPHPICPAAPCCAHARCVSNQRLVSVPEGTQPKAAGASLPELLLHLPRRPSFHLFPLSHDSSYFYIITWSQVFTKIKKK